MNTTWDYHMKYIMSISERQTFHSLVIDLYKSLKLYVCVMDIKTHTQKIKLFQVKTRQKEESK